MPHISRRNWIRWPPEPESEPTNTLVLTSDTGNFVDIRVLKGSSPDEGKEDVLPISRLDWAFAGTATSKQDPDSDGKRASAIWRHWVDSRSDAPELVKDSGEMLSLDDGTSLETGKMVNPARPDAGEVPYEELWKNVSALPTGEFPFATLGDTKGDKTMVARSVSARICVVIMLRDARDRARGMVVRVGQLVQGMFKLSPHSSREPGTSITIERWSWSERRVTAMEGNDDGNMNRTTPSANGVTQGGWQRQLRIGDYWLPCGFAMDVEEGKVRLGQEIEYGEFSWKVVDLSYF